jgi:catechol 2,3-dioxygenase
MRAAARAVAEMESALHRREPEAQAVRPRCDLRPRRRPARQSKQTRAEARRPGRRSHGGVCRRGSETHRAARYCRENSDTRTRNQEGQWHFVVKFIRQSYGTGWVVSMKTSVYTDRYKPPVYHQAMIDPATSIAAVHLTVTDLAQSMAFYTSRLGLAAHGQDARTAWLGADRVLLVLSENHRARHVEGTTGLYHFALLVPSRVELARALRRLVDTSTELQGVADHGVSESLYLADPDGNGIEIYRDRRREEWPRVGGALRMTVDPLDLDGLMRELEPGSDTRLTPVENVENVENVGKICIAGGTVMGHVHLRVANLADAEAFYAGVLGFEVMQRYGHGALFVAAGGYHHHVGLNTWGGVGAPPPPSDAVGLDHVVVQLPGRAARDRVEAAIRAQRIPATTDDRGVLVRDPSGNALLFTA